MATLADLKSQYYKSLGYSGSISDMEYAYYSNPPAGGGGGFTKVANAAALPAPSSSNTGAPYFLTDTGVTVISDGTRWRTTYGDTGLRSISNWNAAGSVQGAPLATDWKPRTGQSGSINLRRFNSTVYLFIDNLACAVADTNSPLYTVPSGFACDINTMLTLPSWTSANAYNVSAFNIQGSPISRAANVSIAVDQYFRGILSWSTSSSWPVTVPGSESFPPN